MLNDEDQCLRTEGLLDLRFVWDEASSSTQLSLLAQQSPLKILQAIPHGKRASLIHLHNVSGGVLGGDQLTLNLRVESKAHAVVTTTGATRLYRQRRERPPARQVNWGRVASGARLEYLPDPTIPYGGSEYQQRNSWYLQGAAALLAWDVVTPGRSGYERNFAYVFYASETEIWHDDRPILIERYRLCPAEKNLGSLARMAESTHMGSLYFCDASLREDAWLALEQEAQVCLATFTERHVAAKPFLAGVSSLSRHGLVVRALSSCSEDIVVAFTAVRALLLERAWQCDDPMPRKLP